MAILIKGMAMPRNCMACDFEQVDEYELSTECSLIYKGHTYKCRTEGRLPGCPLVEVPDAQPERKTGKWERHNTYVGDDTSGRVDPDWRCSECGQQALVNEWFMYDLTNYCPNCGADMRPEPYCGGQQDGSTDMRGEQEWN